MATDAMDPQEKLGLIQELIAETLKGDIIEDVILKQKRPLKIYWGTATTGRPHCAYFVPMIKIAHFLRAGCEIKLLLADIHGFLDNLKAPIELVEYRAQYYKFVVTALLKSLNVPTDRLQFVLGSSYQLSSKYTMDIFRLSSVVTEHDAKKAGAEVVKQVDNATLSGLIYPLMQSLDEEHLDVDVQFGGIDQRKIFTLAAESLPKIGYKARAHLMNPMIPGLAGGKMSASDPDSKIDVLDPADVVKRKLKRAMCVPKEVSGNGVVAFAEYVLFPASALKSASQKEPRFVVPRRDQEPLVYNDITKLKEDYEQDILTPQLLKPAVTDALNALLEPIQEEYTRSQEWQDIALKAYPPPPEAKKKEKKVKNPGTRAPGASGSSGSGSIGKDKDKDISINVEAKPDGHVEGAGKDVVNVAQSAEDAMQKLDVSANGTSN